MRNTRLWICSVLMCYCSAVPLCAQVYPAVVPIRRTFDIAEVTKASVTTFVESPEGRALYKLQCHPAGYIGDPNFDYSGEFECRLSSVTGQDRYSTLLTEDPHQSRDWESRGRFFASDLRGACALIPEFGATRDFKLRGMDLTLQATDVRLAADGKIGALKLIVTVRPDDAARSPITEAVSMPRSDVPPGCDLRQHFVALNPAR